MEGSVDLKMNIPDLNEFIKVEFPQIVDEFEIREISKDSFVLGLMTSQKHLRPGETVSGPGRWEHPITWFSAQNKNTGSVASAALGQCSGLMLKTYWVKLELKDVSFDKIMGIR